jgi:hypothetical protein
MTASRWLASGATIVFGCSHALIGMSRMCTINSTPMIFETIALAFLFGGLKRRCPFLSFLGGMTAGAGMYFYFPSRGIPIIWLIFIGLLLVQPKRQIPRNVVVKLALATALGWFIVISPLLTAALRQPERLKDYMDYSQECSVLSLKGLMIHKDWVGAHSLVEAYTRNMVDALTIFNNGLMDHAWLYVNPNAGFVDALTGCLLWLGLAGMLLSKRRTRDNFVLAGFLTVYLGCALVLNKSPNYSRELIILPFSSFIVADFLLASDALLANFAGFSPRLPERSLKHSFFIGAIATIACLNIHITDDYFRAGLNRGDSVGSTGRYVMERRDKPGYQYFVAADTKQYPYFTHGGPDTWVGFISLFSNDGQSLPVTVILPMMCAKTTLRTPCTMFISRELFEQKGEELLQKYPGAIVHSVLPDGSRLGFELLKEKQIEMPKHRYSGRQMSASSASP